VPYLAQKFEGKKKQRRGKRRTFADTQIFIESRSVEHRNDKKRQGEFSTCGKAPVPRPV
jgi:hypothetical protein